MIGAVDIGGTKIAVGMIDDAGHVRSRLQCPTYPERGYPDALNRITAMIEEAHYDPSLRFVLVALGLFVVFIILLVLSKVMG